MTDINTAGEIPPQTESNMKRQKKSKYYREIAKAYQAGKEDSKEWIYADEKRPVEWQEVVAVVEQGGRLNAVVTTYFDHKEWLFAGSPVICWRPIPSYKGVKKQ